MSNIIYILLPVHNRRSITECFINCLLAQSYKKYHLILIDDGSTDGTDILVKEKINELTILKGTGSWWWAGSLQQGIDWLNQKSICDQDIVMFANDDIEFDPDFLLRAVDILGKRDGMLLPKIFAGNDKKPIESGIEADLRRLSFQVASSPEKINCLPTRGLFMRMWVVRHVGDFYPKLLPHYLSDYEYTIRANKKGIKLYTSNELLISFDKNTTGFHSFKNLPFINRMKNYFSKKSAANPVYWTIFILLASPSQHIPWQIIRVWLGAVKLILTSR